MLNKEILELGLGSTGTGGSPDRRAIQMQYRLLTEAQRVLFRVLDIPEVFDRKPVQTVANQDWVPTPADVYAIMWIENRPSAFKLKKEPEGYIGRARFFETDEDRPFISGEPGSVNFYVRKEDRIYLRDTPDRAFTLDISYRLLPPALTEADLEVKSPLPEQYDFPLSRIFSGVYYSLHPPLDPNTQVPLVDYGRNIIDREINELLGRPGDPEELEDLDSHRTAWQPGYQFNIR